MDIHERNNHLECNMNNEGTRSHYKCPTHPLCSPLTPTAPSPAGPIHYFALDYLWPLVRFQRKWNCSFPSARLLARGSQAGGCCRVQTWGPTGAILKLWLSVVKLGKNHIRLRDPKKGPTETPLMTVAECVVISLFPVFWQFSPSLPRSMAQQFRAAICTISAKTALLVG